MKHLVILTTALIAAASLLVASSCAELKLPNKDAMVNVFTARSQTLIEEPPPPDSVPILATAEMSDWSALCDHCHVGPHYSSYTILNWGHRDSCVSNKACSDCHAEKLHLTHIRGDKAACIDCHLAQGISIACGTCHDAQWHDQHTAHIRGFTGMHDMKPEWQGTDCLVCHGSNNWCLDCHGLPMPHPDDIDKTHPQLVRGQPEICARCHGTYSCYRCHYEHGIEITEETEIPEGPLIPGNTALREDSASPETEN
jgi:hypothetical protein